MIERLIEIADALDKAHRIGASIDSPEGSQIIQLSDTLAKQLSKELREIAEAN